MGEAWEISFSGIPDGRLLVTGGQVRWSPPALPTPSQVITARCSVCGNTVECRDGDRILYGDLRLCEHMGGVGGG